MPQEENLCLLVGEISSSRASKELKLNLEPTAAVFSLQMAARYSKRSDTVKIFRSVRLDARLSCVDASENLQPQVTAAAQKYIRRSLCSAVGSSYSLLYLRSCRQAVDQVAPATARLWVQSVRRGSILPQPGQLWASSITPSNPD
jgi:hypothetical protein